MYDMIKLRYHKFKKSQNCVFYGLASKWAHNLKLTKKMDLVLKIVQFWQVTL